MNKELFDLAKERLAGVHREDQVKEPYRFYFQRVAFFLLDWCRIYEQIEAGEHEGWDLAEWERINTLLYADIAGDAYRESLSNPTCATKLLGETFGSFLAYVYAQLRSCIPDLFEQNGDRFLMHIQYFLELYTSFATAAEEGRNAPDYESVRDGLYDFIFYAYEQEADKNISAKVDPSSDFALRIIEASDPSDLRYLYRFGEYVSANEIETAKYLASLPKETLQLMADTYTEGYRIGFEKTGKDLSIKGTVHIIYPLGYEAIIKLAIANFEKMGLKPTIPRDAVSVLDRRYGNESGYYSTRASRQYDFDHREDNALFLDKKMLQRRLDCMKNAYEERKAMARLMAGPAVIEVFGQNPFDPEVRKEAPSLSETQRKLKLWFDNMRSELVDGYIPEKERSFTIIAFPLPEIGDQYTEIMQETIRLNTLDWRKFEKIQQGIIDALDQCGSVHILGRGENQTDLTVQLYELTDPAKQTIFENCVADVNIPVGEVFTSPVLKGTQGLLHVTRVFLNGLEYRQLRLRFEDGRVKEYSCDNFEDPEGGKKLMYSQILFHHKDLAIGEFAVGTNTTAYRMGKKYGIEGRLPILIAEKTGPHLAVGDTCYSYSEDIRVYNPDGKEIVAKDNEVSLNRRSDDEEVKLSAYFNCHTDITIPYHELGLLAGIKQNGEQIPIIKDGRFVLPGTEALNEALDQI